MKQPAGDDAEQGCSPDQVALHRYEPREKWYQSREKRRRKATTCYDERGLETTSTVILANRSANMEKLATNLGKEDTCTLCAPV